MTYMSSISSGDGTSNITVTFDVGYNLSIAAVDVQNRVTMALPQVPNDVRKYGVTTQKQSPDFVLIMCLYSENTEHGDLFLSNYAAINIVDQLKRLPGVGDVEIFGEKKYAMRLWLNPDKLTSMDMTAMDVINAVQEQNVQVAAGSIGQAPSPPGQVFTYSINTLGRLATPKEFEDIIVRTKEDGFRCTGQGCEPGGTGSRKLRLVCASKWWKSGLYRRVSVTGGQCAAGGQGSLRHHGAAQEAISGRPQIYRRL